MENEDQIWKRKKIAKWMAFHRRRFGYTVEKLSELTGIAVSTIKRFESGNNWINLKQFVILCEALKLESYPTMKPKEETTE